MSDEAERAHVMAGLRGVLASDTLADAAREHAENLLERLGSGVNVVVVGPKAIGKSQLCDVLLAQSLPGSDGVATTYCYGDATASTWAGVGPRPLQNDFLEMTTVTDVTVSGGLDDFTQNTQAAVAHADIVLWCTAEFGAAEAEVWAATSDHTKDHSFLVLTQADKLAAQGKLPNAMAALQSVAADEFHSFFPTSTLQAHQTLIQQGDIPVDQRAASGVAALSETLLGLAASGRRADLDSALLFLQRHRSTDLAEEPEAAADASAVTAHLKTYQKALDLLQARKVEIVGVWEDDVDRQPDNVLACCGTLAEALAEIASAATHTAPDFEAWRNDLYEASDKVVLMSLENDLRSAADAATIILQLNRDLQARVIH